MHHEHPVSVVTEPTPAVNTPVAANEVAPVETINATSQVESEEEETSSSDTVIATIGGFDFTKQEFKESKKTGKSNPLATGGYGFASLKITDIFKLVSHFDHLCKEQNKTVQEEKEVTKIVDGKTVVEKITTSRLLTGQEIMQDLLQTAYDAKLRIKVKSMLPKIGDAGIKTEADIVTWLENKVKDDSNKLLFTAEEASKWIPGLRELSQAKKLEIKMLDVKQAIAKYGVTDSRVQKMLADIALAM